MLHPDTISANELSSVRAQIRGLEWDHTVASLQYKLSGPIAPVRGHLTMMSSIDGGVAIGCTTDGDSFVKSNSQVIPVFVASSYNNFEENQRNR